MWIGGSDINQKQIAPPNLLPSPSLSSSILTPTLTHTSTHPLTLTLIPPSPSFIASELSKTVATFIVQKILLDETGLACGEDSNPRVPHFCLHLPTMHVQEVW